MPDCCYCMRCQRPTPDIGAKIVSCNGRSRISAMCRCGARKSKFVKSGTTMKTMSKKKVSKGQTGEGLGDIINRGISGLGVELHLPSTDGGFYNYLGPGTKLPARVKELAAFRAGEIAANDCNFKNCSEPINALDRIAMQHDLAYNRSKDNEIRKQADRLFIEKVNNLLEGNTLSAGQRVTAQISKSVIGVKTALSKTA